jgi:hypothetical protein
MRFRLSLLSWGRFYFGEDRWSIVATLNAESLLPGLKPFSLSNLNAGLKASSSTVALAELASQCAELVMWRASGSGRRERRS